MEIRNWPDVTAWEKLANNCPEATFFHTPLWHEIVVQTYTDYAIATVEFELDEGIQAVFPCIQTKKEGLIKKKLRLKSSVFGTYGGIISEKMLSPDQQARIYSCLQGLNARISINTNPFSKNTLPDTFSCKDNFTHVFTIPSDEDEAYRKLSRGAKSNLNQAKKKGVTVRPATTLQDISTYYAIYQETLKRWGDATLFVYPEKLFNEIFQKADDAAKFWLAEKDGTIIAGVLIFYWNRIVSYWHGASLQDYFSCYPNNMLHMEIIRDAAARNFTYYDFGASGGQEGVIRFKRSFRAEEYPFVSGRLK